MTDLEWTRTLVVIGMIGQVALAVDRWVHRQSGDGTRIKERVDELVKLIKEAADRTHRHNKVFQRQISRVELCIALLQQRAGIKFPRIADESDDEDEEAS